MAASVLLVAVRGWTTTGDWLLFGVRGGELRADFTETLAAELADTEVWAPDLDLDMFSMRTAESLSQELFDKIDRKVATMPGLQRIMLLGYSCGSVLARRVFSMAHGAAPDGSISLPPAPWADKIDRIVMLAGITRGWEFSSASPAHVRFFAPILYKIASIVGWFKRRSETVESHVPFIWQLKRGSPFIVSTRIQYVNVFHALERRADTKEDGGLRAKGLPSTVFLVGAKDEHISPADCTELGPRIEFAFIELAGCNHAEATLIAGPEAGPAGRRMRLAAAVSEDFTALTGEEWAVPASDIDDYLDPMDLTASDGTRGSRRATVEHAVMIVHGIRDNGFWTKRVAREVKMLARENDIVVRAPTPSYGYFSMLDFVWPGGREQATYWFMERYADVRSQFPNAKISFVGHSNGTYIAARALELCPAIKFENVVFAGSVVRRGFEWGRFAGRVRGVLNYVGNGDGVVAFLPAVFELLRLRWLDVGGAGAFGFREAEPPPAVRRRLPEGAGETVELSEFRFVAGGHGAAITEQFWPEIAQFVLFNTLPVREAVVRRDRIKLFFRCAPVLTIAGFVFIAACLTLPFTLVAYVSQSAMAAVGAVLVGTFVSWLAGRFLRMW